VSRKGNAMRNAMRNKTFQQTPNPLVIHINLISLLILFAVRVTIRNFLDIHSLGFSFESPPLQ